MEPPGMSLGRVIREFDDRITSESIQNTSNDSTDSSSPRSVGESSLPSSPETDRRLYPQKMIIPCYHLSKLQQREDQVNRPDEVNRIEQALKKKKKIVIDDTATGDGVFIAEHVTGMKRIISLDASSDLAFCYSCSQNSIGASTLKSSPQTLFTWLNGHPHTLVFIPTLENLSEEYCRLLENCRCRVLIVCCDPCKFKNWQRIHLRALTKEEYLTIPHSHFTRCQNHPQALLLASKLKQLPSVCELPNLFSALYAQLSKEAQDTLRLFGCFHPDHLPTRGRSGIDELRQMGILWQNQIPHLLHQLVSKQCTVEDCQAAYQLLIKRAVRRYLVHLHYFFAVAHRVRFSHKIDTEVLLSIPLRNWEEIGDNHQIRGAFTQALQAYHYAYTLQALPSDYLVRKLGEMQLQCGHLLDALTTLEYTKNLIDDAKTLTLLAQVHFHLDLTQEAERLALEAINKGVVSFEYWLEAYFTHCFILLASNRFDELKMNLRKLKEILPKQLDQVNHVSLQLLEGYLALRGVSGYIYQTIIPPSDHPIRHEVTILEGLMLCKMQYLDGAEKKFDEAIKGLTNHFGTHLHPRIADCYVYLLDIHKQQKNQLLRMRDYRAVHEIYKAIYPPEHGKRAQLKF